MTKLQRYHAADLPVLMDKITKNSIGLDDYFNNFFTSNGQVEFDLSGVESFIANFSQLSNLPARALTYWRITSPRHSGSNPNILRAHSISKIRSPWGAGC